jgi:hypothetical protein
MYITIRYFFFFFIFNEPALVQDYGDDNISDTFRLADDDLCKCFYILIIYIENVFTFPL